MSSTSVRIFLRVLAFLCVAAAIPNQARGQSLTHHVWFAGEITSAQPLIEAQSFETSVPKALEFEFRDLRYPKGRRVGGYEFGGGVDLFRGLGVGVRASSLLDTVFTTLGVEDPNPSFFGVPSRGLADTAIEIEQKTLDLSLTYRLETHPRLEGRVAVGATRVALSQDAIETFSFTVAGTSAGLSLPARRTSCPPRRGPSWSRTSRS